MMSSLENDPFSWRENTISKTTFTRWFEIFLPPTFLEAGLLVWNLPSSNDIIISIGLDSIKQWDCKSQENSLIHSMASPKI
jgi:hypothetical protein